MRRIHKARRMSIMAAGAAVLSAGAWLAVWSGCSGRSEVAVAADTEMTPGAAAGCDNAAPPVKLQLGCPALPDTIATGQIVTEPTGGKKYLDFDLFAWNSFIALNWPAVVPSEANGWKRGFPDTSKTFQGTAPGDLTVWETYKEKREIFLADPFTGEVTANPKPAPWNSEPVYGPADQQVPFCPGTEGAAEIVPFERHIAHATKVNSAFDALDETAEVASEARELDQVLCQGHRPDCNVHGLAVGPRVWRGQPNDGGAPVLYEVKINWDFYDYAATFPAQPGSKQGSLWVEDNARKAATNGKIRLPARTSAADPPFQPGTGFKGNPSTQNGVNPIASSYSAKSCATYDGATPCPAGSVHLKAAWLPLTQDEAASGEYHTATAYYYQDYTPKPGQPGYDPNAPADEQPVDKCRMPAQFGLIGFHIIQRIHEQIFDQQGKPFAQAGSRGGTFVFATWEHVGNDGPPDDPKFTYANLFPTRLDGKPVTDPKPYPNVRKEGVDAIPLRRAYDLLPTTKTANKLAHDALGCPGSGSVWCNYKLIGTQYRAADTPSPVPKLLTELPENPLPNVESPARSGQPYYLANLVVESNLGLQQFQGLPPNSYLIGHFTMPQPPPGGTGNTRGQRGDAPEIVSNETTRFAHGMNNLAWRIAPRKSPASGNDSAKSYIHTKGGHKKGGSWQGGIRQGAYNMGGCMGCHGVAQLNGYAFSFVLLGNQAGGVPDTHDEVEIPPLPLDVGTTSP